MSRIKRGLPLFWIFLGVYAAVLFSGVMLLLNDLTDRLVDYESGQQAPVVAVAENVFDTFFANGFDRVCDEYCPSLSPFEDKEDFKAALTSLAEGNGLALSEAYRQEGDSYFFDVTNSGAPLASFSLSPIDGGGWQLDGITFALEPKEQITVTVYTGDNAYVNGIMLTEEYETGRTADHPLNSLIPLIGGEEGGYEEIYAVTYSVSGLYMPPAVTCDGELQKTGENEYKAELIYHSRRESEVSDRIISSVEAYCDYLYRASPLSDAAIYIDSTGPLYAELKSTEAFFSEEAEEREYENITISELYFFGEDIFTCRVTFNGVLEGDSDSFDLTLIYRRPNRAWMMDKVINNSL